jgi:hypothetical protein
MEFRGRTVIVGNNAAGASCQQKAHRRACAAKRRPQGRGGGGACEPGLYGLRPADDGRAFDPVVSLGPPRAAGASPGSVTRRVKSDRRTVSVGPASKRKAGAVFRRFGQPRRDSCYAYASDGEVVKTRWPPAFVTSALQIFAAHSPHRPALT